jgi:nitroreductase
MKNDEASVREAPDSLRAAIRNRHSQRAPFDPTRRIPESALAEILDAARWAPTAHNMQNFEIVVVDEPERLGALGRIEAPVSEVFVRENFRQLSFSHEELRRKRVGVLAETFPPAWRQPEVTAAALAPSQLAATIRAAPMVLVVTYDPGVRAPASEGDVLGMMSLGCVMQNIWLATHDLGIGLHVMSTFAGEAVSGAVKQLLAIPPELRVAFALALGYPAGTPAPALRVRREPEAFAHRNRYRSR